jgi:hypothetical protein
MPAAKKYAKVNVAKLKLSEVHPVEYNARTITNEALTGLSASLETFGLLAFPVVNKTKTGYRIVGGHQRVDAMKQAGVEEAQFVVVEFDANTEKQANFALNNRAIQGEFVPTLTKALIDDIQAALGKDAPQFGDLRMDSLLKTIMRTMRPEVGVDDVEIAGKVDDDKEASVSKTTAVSRAGAFYKLGHHVLFCGKLSGKATLSGFPVERADAGLTYFASGSDVTDAYLDLWLGHMLGNVDGPIYVATSTDLLVQTQRRFVALEGHWSNTLLWYSPESRPEAQKAYRNIVIPVLYGWREGSTHYFCGKRDQGNVFKLKRAPRAGLPVEVMTKLLLNSTKAGGYVLDPNVGKGVSVIAAEKTNRRIVGYVGNAREMDAVRKRWVDFTQPPGTNWRTATPEL